MGTCPELHFHTEKNYPSLRYVRYYQKKKKSFLNITIIYAQKRCF